MTTTYTAKAFGHTFQTTSRGVRSLSYAVVIKAFSPRQNSDYVYCLWTSSPAQAERLERQARGDRYQRVVEVKHVNPERRVSVPKPVYLWTAAAFGQVFSHGHAGTGKFALITKQTYHGEYDHETVYGTEWFGTRERAEARRTELDARATDPSRWTRERAIVPGTRGPVIPADQPWLGYWKRTTEEQAS